MTEPTVLSFDFHSMKSAQQPVASAIFHIDERSENSDIEGVSDFQNHRNLADAIEDFRV